MQCAKTIEVRDDTKDGKQWVPKGSDAGTWISCGKSASE